MSKLINTRNIVIILFFGIFSMILTFPILLTKGVVVGADFLFHYNRFYETAMQIKNCNLSPYISIYGFQESGRIINTVYGPVFAYMQGLLVLVSGSWFKYQILSNFLLNFLSMVSLCALMKSVKVKDNYAVLLSCFYSTTYAIQYWQISQGFSSWGAALFPLCFLVAIQSYKTEKVNIIALAVSVAVMFQVHVLSTFFLVVSYLPIFGTLLLKSQNKKRLLRDIVLSVLLFLLLSMNVWLPLIELNVSNSLRSPFVNSNFIYNTVTWRDWEFLVYPLSFPVLFAWYAIVKWKDRKSSKLTILSATYLMLFLLSTNLFPWPLVAGKGISLVEMIQFPFRFFFYATPLFLLDLGVSLSAISRKESQKKGLVLVGVTVFVALLGISYNSYSSINNRYDSQVFLSNLKNTHLFGDSDALRAAFHSEDMGTLLKLAQKSTPDYLPNYNKDTRLFDQSDKGISKYKVYMNRVINNSDPFQKSLDGNQLVIEWEHQGEIEVPVIVYESTVLQLNGTVLKKSDYHISSIGTPILKGDKDTNRLVVSYLTPQWFYPVLVLVALSWLVVVYFGINSRKHLDKYDEKSFK